MKLIVVGAGATGAFYGALAKKGGADVTLVARGRHGDALRDRGVIVMTPDGEWNVEASVVPAIPAGERFDVAFVTVKMHDLEGVLPATAAVADAVIVAQNGVEAEEVAARFVPKEKLAGAILVIGASVPSPGVVKLAGRHFITVGAPFPEGKVAAKQAHDLLTGVGLPMRWTDDLPSARWQKLVWNNAFNALTALTGLTAKAAATHREIRELARRSMTEVVAVARASGVPLGDEVIDAMLMAGEAVGDVETSTLQDVKAGRPLEADALCGVIVRKGRALGVPTPVNEVLYPLLLGLDARRA